MLHGLAELRPLAPYSELVKIGDAPAAELAASVGLPAAVIDQGWEAFRHPARMSVEGADPECRDASKSAPLALPLPPRSWIATHHREG